MGEMIVLTHQKEKKKKSQILPQSLNLSKLSTFIYEINARKICDFFVTLKFLYLW